MSIAVPVSGAPGIARTVLPGVAVTVMLALAAGWIAGGLGEPLARNPVLVAMLFGLLIGNSFAYPDGLRPGFDFTKRYLLRLAVVLVGFRITTQLLLDLGVVPLAVAATELVVVLVGLRFVARRIFKLDNELALLIAVGSAVCGAAAILSVAALTRARDQSAGIAIALITLSGTAALLLYPVAFMDGWLPDFDDRLYGVFVGASIYELAQVYGASFAVSEGALNTATLVKLGKVLMLIPLVLVLGVLERRRGAAVKSTPALLSLVHRWVRRCGAAELGVHAPSAAAPDHPRCGSVPLPDGHGRAGPHYSRQPLWRSRRRLAPDRSGVGRTSLVLFPHLWAGNLSLAGRKRCSLVARGHHARQRRRPPVLTDRLRQVPCAGARRPEWRGDALLGPAPPRHGAGARRQDRSGRCLRSRLAHDAARRAPPATALPP